MGNKLFGIEFYFGSLILLIILLFLAGQYQNWQKRTKSARMVFRLPLAARFILGGIGLWFVLTPPWLMARDIRDGTGLFLFLVYELMACAMGSLFFWGVGTRRELDLDVERRSYHFITGWGPWTRVRSGGLEDFTGIFVRCTSGRDSEIYTVGLAWKWGECISPTLGNFRGRSRGKPKADALAAKMGNALGLPLVAAPPREELRNPFRHRSNF